MKHRVVAAAVVAVSTIGLVWTNLPSAEADTAELGWRDCGGDAQCATLTVPVDWNEPDGPSTRVNLAKLPARDPQPGTPPLVVNLGAGNVTQALEGQVPPGVQALNERFDIIGFDPRGLGKADNDTLIQCGKAEAPYPDLILAENASDWDEHAGRNAAYEKSCRDAAGDRYAGLNSWQTAHDVDALRAALGQQRLTYLGNSYGASYGQEYARLFPQRVQRMYLEGVPDHTQSNLEDWLANYARTQEEQLTEFADWCAKRDGCALNGSDAAKVWDDLVAQAEAEPLPAPGAGDGESVNVRELFAGAHFGMNPPYWPRLAAAMAAARDGDATDFLTGLASEAANEEPGGYVQAAVLCNDYLPETPGYREMLDIEDRLRDIAPRFGWISARAELSRCVGMEAEPAYPPRPLDIDAIAPVLFGSGDLDNNTPHHGIENVAKQFPGSSVLRHGDGHAAIVLGNTCLAEHAMAYLAEGRMPAEGTRCPGQLVDQISDRP